MSSDMLYPLALFSFSECERFLADLSDADARVRLSKADGGEMNGISWLVGHMAWQWVRLATRAAYARDLPEMDRKFGQLPQSDDEPLADLRRRVYPFRTNTEIAPDPPPIDEAMGLLREAKSATADWLRSADERLLASMVRAGDAVIDEPISKNVVRNALHTFTHSGEVLAVRQMLGHPEIGFLQMGDFHWPE